MSEVVIDASMGTGRARDGIACMPAWD